MGLPVASSICPSLFSSTQTTAVAGERMWMSVMRAGDVSLPEREELLQVVAAVEAHAERVLPGCVYGITGGDLGGIELRPAFDLVQCSGADGGLFVDRRG
jgi:hypothetical protein